jgi:betaine-aldehyde dehydrogenase
MSIACKETLSPVAVLIPFKDENHAVLQANQTPDRLGAGIRPRDVRRARDVVRALRVGSVWVKLFRISSVALAGLALSPAETQSTSLRVRSVSHQTIGAGLGTPAPTWQLDERFHPIISEARNGNSSYINRQGS